MLRSERSNTETFPDPYLRQYGRTLLHRFVVWIRGQQRSPISIVAISYASNVIRRTRPRQFAVLNIMGSKENSPSQKAG